MTKQTGHYGICGRVADNASSSHVAKGNSWVNKYLHR
jgi:hypothetical protein